MFLNLKIKYYKMMQKPGLYYLLTSISIVILYLESEKNNWTGTGLDNWSICS